MRRLRVFTWHIHGSYLYYLSQAPHDFFVPVKPGRPDRYFGRTRSYAWPGNLHEVPAEKVRDLSFDCVLYQHRLNYTTDQYETLSATQRRLPRLYLEHDLPQENPVDTRHIVEDPEVLIVHVTHFNALMWDNGPNAVRVIEHGVLAPPGVCYSGEIPRGIVVVNNMKPRGRKIGADVYARVRERIPLDLVGMGWREMEGGIGEIRHSDLFSFIARYRFFFNPIRYSSCPLSLLEAMSAGAPIVALATTGLVSFLENGRNAFLSDDPSALLEPMRRLLADRSLAARIGEGARRTADERFSIARFTDEWSRVFAEATSTRRSGTKVAIANVHEASAGDGS